jgi:hypothetical protein
MITDVLIDVYVTLFMYALLSSNLYERTRVGYVCIRQSNLVVCIEK